MAGAFKTIGVIGGGLMGHGIALVFARAGYQALIFDPIPEVRAGLMARIRDSHLAMGGAPADFAQIEGRITIQDELAKVAAPADLIFEAAPEKIALKQQLLAEAAAAAPEGALICSNTSVIPITTLAQNLSEGAKARMLGTHWWNPPHLIPLVELVPTEWTDPTAMDRVFDLLTEVGKTPVRLNRDITGFIGNRLQAALWREAVALVEAGVCDAATIDTVVKASFGRRLAVLGPMENLDLIGTDLTLDIHGIILPEIDSRPHPSPLLERLVSEGHLGMKTGEGFQSWDAERAAKVRARLANYLRQIDAHIAEAEPKA